VISVRRGLTAAAFLVAAGAAAAAVTDRSVTSPGAVLGLARGGLSVAFVSGPSPGHCGDRVRLWSLVSRGVTPLGRHTDAACRQGPAGGSGISSVSVAGSRVLWLFHASGNRTGWQVFTATTTRPTERQLEFEEVDVDATPPIVLGDGSNQVLPYAAGKRRTVKVLAANGRRLYTWAAPARVNALTSYGNEVAVFMSGGKAVVLSPTGAVAQTYAFPPGAVAFRLAGVGLVVQLPNGVVQIRRGAATVKTLTLPAGAQMLDYAEGILLYSLGTEVRGVRVRTGKDVVIRDVRRKPVLAQLEHNGLSYAIGKRVYSVAMVNVNALFNR
jgi:hypothetical protein